MTVQFKYGTQANPIPGRDPFFYYEKSTIKMRLLTANDVAAVTLQHTTFTLILDKEGSSREITLNHTISKDIVQGSKDTISAWKTHLAHIPMACKVQELETLYGWVCSPQHTYSLHLYTTEDQIAEDLRNTCRLLGGTFGHVPLSAFIALEEFRDVIKSNISEWLYLMPTVRRNYFNNPPPPPVVVLSPRKLPPPPQSEYNIEDDTTLVIKCDKCQVKLASQSLMDQHIEFH